MNILNDLKERSESANRVMYWILCALIYLTLLYSTSLQNGFGPEKGITLNYFTTPKTQPPHTPVTNFEKFFPDQGILYGTEFNFIGDDFWKMSGFFGDAGFYVLQSNSLDLSIPPFKYRFIPTAVIGMASRTFGWTIPDTFVIFNLILLVLTALMFTFFLHKYFNFSKIIALIGGILFISMAPSTRTLPFPSLEPASFFISILLFIAAVSRKRSLFLVSSLIGVATKEVFLLSGILWLASEYPIQKKRIAIDLLIAAVPIFGFALIRYIIGGNPADINFGYNILKGEFPRDYASRLFHPSTLLDLFIRVFLSFSFLWLGLLNLRKNPFLLRCSLFIPIVILAAILLSGQITRVLGILFPIVITMFLFFFQNSYNSVKNEKINTAI